MLHVAGQIQVKPTTETYVKLNLYLIRSVIHFGLEAKRKYLRYKIQGSFIYITQFTSV